MKQSWVVGIVAIYVCLQALTMIAQASTTGDSTIWKVLDNVFQYNLSTSIASQVSMVWSAAGAVVAFFMSFLQVITMYYPAIFTGYYVWFWWCVCLPISAGFVMSVVSIIRGVHTS